MIVDSDGGLGNTTTQIAQTAGATALTIAPATGPAAPFVAAAGLITTLVSGLFKPDLSKIQATEIVNDIEPALRQNVNQWLSLPVTQKTIDNQKAFLDVFNQGWSGVVNGCNKVGGDAGANCINDRSRGGRWDWFSYYYDPIANDTQVHEGETIVSQVTSALSLPNFDLTKMIIPLAVIVGGAFLLGDSSSGRGRG